MSVPSLETQPTDQRLLVMERQVLEGVAAGAPLADSLLTIARLAEEYSPGALCALLLLEADGAHLRYATAPSLPADFVNAAVGLAVGPKGGSCATAAYRRESVIVADIATDFLRKEDRDRALSHGLRSCWSMPILSSNGVVLGTFATYHRTPRRPSASELETIARMSHLASVAIERQRADEALRRSEARYRQLYDEAPTMFFTLDTDGIVAEVNQAGARYLGYRVDELLGLPSERLCPPEYRAAAREQLRACLDNAAEVRHWDLPKLCKNGERLWVRETARVMVDIDGASRLLVLCEDVTEAYRLSAQLSYQASHDGLTGLANRNSLVRHLEQSLDKARTSGTRHSLCHLNLDQFKVINDTGGRQAGDALLHELAVVLRARLRQGDVLARLEGDTFAVVLQDCTGEQAERKAQELHAAVQQLRFDWQGKHFALSASIGLVPIDAARGDPEALLEAAQRACHSAKARGGSRVHGYRPDDSVLVKRQGDLHWVAEISQALEQDRFRLYAQSIVALRPGAHDRCQRHELLLRMESRSGEIITAGAFLPTAERYNLAVKIDRWVVTRALRSFQGHTGADSGSELAINLSGQSLGDEAFQDFLVRELQGSGVSPRRICFEVTETAAIADLASATRFMNTLKQLGCLFSLDDFGSGLSSYGYLKNLPVDFLKIDGSFVKDIVDDEIDCAMVRSINEVGHIMGKRTIAEFAENEQIVARLRELGVDYAQGFGIARPRPLEEI